MLNVSRELDLLRENAKKLEKKIGRHLSIDHFKHSKDDMLFYIGLPKYAMFQSVLKVLNPGQDGEIKVSCTKQQEQNPSRAGRPRSLTVKNEFFFPRSVALRSL